MSEGQNSHAGLACMLRLYASSPTRNRLGTLAPSTLPCPPYSIRVNVPSRDAAPWDPLPSPFQIILITLIDSWVHCTFLPNTRTEAAQVNDYTNFRPKKSLGTEP